MGRLERTVLQKLFPILSSLTCHQDVNSQFNSHPIFLLRRERQKIGYMKLIFDVFECTYSLRS